MAWIYLAFAGLLEVAFATCLKYSEGFTKLVPSLLFFPASIGSFALLTLALKNLPVGTAYAMWTGIGAVGTAVVGMVVLGESRELPRILSLVVLTAGLLGLRLTGGGH